MNKILITILIVILIGFGILITIGLKDKREAPLGYFGFNAMSQNLTNASSTVKNGNDAAGSNPVPAIAANTGRTWIRICKIDTLDQFWLHLTNSTSSGVLAAEGILLATTTPCFTMDSNGIWLGAIWAVGNATSGLTYSESSE